MMLTGIRQMEMLQVPDVEITHDHDVMIKMKSIGVCGSDIHYYVSGKIGNQFPLDIFQSGSGTSVNMNVNEVVANRAAEILGGKKGSRKLVHPNNHVNNGQSTNNVIPSAIRLAAWSLLPGLLDSLSRLEQALKKKAHAFKKIIKTYTMLLHIS